MQYKELTEEKIQTKIFRDIGRKGEIPSINNTISTPFDTCYCKCVATEYNTFFQRNIPNTSIPIFAGTCKAAARSIQMDRFPRDTGNPFLVALQFV